MSENGNRPFGRVFASPCRRMAADFG